MRDSTELQGPTCRPACRSCTSYRPAASRATVLRAVRAVRAGTLVLIVLSAAAAAADDDSKRLRLRGLLDFRIGATDKTESWLDGGLGKLRYGGDGRASGALARLSQCSILFSLRANDSTSVRAQVNIDADPRSYDLGSRIQPIEAYLSYRPVLSPYLRLKTRAGLFFPEISLENTGPGWTTPYTITPSAANSWIGEEVRTIGAEASLVGGYLSNEFTFTFAAYGYNDPAGVLLAWRGWAIHDRQTGAWERLPLIRPALYSRRGHLPAYATPFDPFREIDGRVGWYSSARWKSGGWLDTNYFYYDNRADPLAFDGSQYAWHTRFSNLGVHLSTPGNLDLLGQSMWGWTMMGGPTPRVYTGFYANYVMLSQTWGPSRFSIRFDRFWNTDLDHRGPSDDNGESGTGWTGAMIVNTTEHNRIAVELIHLRSRRPERDSQDLPVEAAEVLVQLSFRILI
ncbi:MAG: hypothetical protein AB1714_20715 [Acidobacteriota bacterium]